MPVSSPTDLDRRIVAALMVDGRAPWTKIAGALGVPDRTVTRRGTALLESGAVGIHALADPHRTGRGDPFVVSLSCTPAVVWPTCASIARRGETVTTYVVSGRAQCLADMWCPETRQAQLFLHELGATPGVTEVEVAPVLRYIQTLTTWDPGILERTEVDALRVGDPITTWPVFGEPARLDREDKALLRGLVEDGRRTFEELGRLAGVSEQTTARRVETMRASGLVTLRAVVDPRVLGLPVAALLRLRIRPPVVETVAAALTASPHVRYAAMVMGEHQIVADVRLPTKDALRQLLTGAEWTEHVEAMESSLILDVLKQSEVLASSLR
ncbi:Lrp/AsnC family transcriptional regulator [Nocardioides sp. SLBN-35]|uniref:Lrp/AsnC family transcriptional regulator n=1 Tax=Nocardioides sp. SLBN-35 TaxID=2768445 RepID=UPI00114F0425|nr:AsnC family transcriptional regulator [Nocardioides sp. SLBN-35]TQK72892.1 DNA-binding Lrp family transcriptional regulator [Nocardioides sp. SLBN-35]